MSEIEGWLAQIGNCPEDRTVRLVFADWLQDAGDLRADAVRSAPTAEEALLEFPYEWRGTAFGGGGRQQVSGICPTYRTFRPVLCLFGGRRIRLINLTVNTDSPTTVGLQCRTQTHRIWEGVFPVQKDITFLAGHILTNSEPLFLTAATDPPALVNWNLNYTAETGDDE